MRVARLELSLHRGLPVLLAVGLAACSSSPPDRPADQFPEPPLSVELPGLVPTDATDECAWELPVEHECEGPSPELVFDDIPASAESLVLIFDDPDARDYPHWAVWGLPADTPGLAEGVSESGLTPELPEGSQELENGFGWVGYLGSCPRQSHVYRWTVWAMPEGFAFDAPGGSARTEFAALRAAAEAEALSRGYACHVYGPRS